MMVNGLHAIVINDYDVHVYYTMLLRFEIYQNKKKNKKKNQWIAPYESLGFGATLTFLQAVIHWHC